MRGQSQLTLVETTHFIEAVENNAPLLVSKWWASNGHLFGTMRTGGDYDVDQSWRIVALLSSIASWQGNSKEYQ